MKLRTCNGFLTKYVLAFVAAVLVLAAVSWASDDSDKDRPDVDKRIEASATVLNEIMSTPDKAIPDKIMRDAKCIAVVPSMVKIALVFGATMVRVWLLAGPRKAGARPHLLPLPAAVGACKSAARRLTSSWWSLTTRE